ncbi:MAG: hypothetical protein ACJ75J_09300 [Cytophagaceae bacterium]
MRKIVFSLLIVLPLTLCTASFFAAKPSYRIFFVQDNIRTEVFYDDKVLELRKAPFKIEVHLYNIEGVFTSISYVPSYYNVPENKNFVKPEDIGPMCQAEDNNNSDLDILVNNETFCYWYYDRKDSLCRFDKGVQEKADHAEGTMSVENLFDPDKQSGIPVSEFTQPLFFVFFTTKENKQGLCTKILERKKIKITFR